MLAVPYLAQLIRTVLSGMPLPNWERAVPLLLGVAAQESGLEHTKQLGGGPARGYWQMEPTTEKDHWQWLKAQNTLRNALVERCGVEEATPPALQHNMPYQIIMVRIHFYRRDPEALPAVNDLQEQAVRWKTFYNTLSGKGTREQYITTWHRLIALRWSPPAP